MSIDSRKASECVKSGATALINFCECQNSVPGSKLFPGVLSNENVQFIQT